MIHYLVIGHACDEESEGLTLKFREEKTVAFTSRSTPGSDTKLPIHTINKQGSLYVFEINDFGRFDASYKYPAKIYLDVKKKTMIYAWYDQYGDRSFVSRINKLSINVSKSTSS